NGLTLAEAFAVEDKIIDAIDAAGLGLGRIQASNVDVTPSSSLAPPTTAANIQRAVSVADSGRGGDVAAGAYSGDVDVNRDVTLAPGGRGAPGAVTQTGDVAFTSGGSTTVDVDINGPAAGTQYDQLNASGAVNLGGANLVLGGAFVPANGDVF